MTQEEFNDIPPFDPSNGQPKENANIGTTEIEEVVSTQTEKTDSGSDPEEPNNDEE